MPEQKKWGLHFNGWRITWPVCVAFVAVVGNAAVVQYRIVDLERRVASAAEQARRVEVIDNRIKNNASIITHHRLYEHATGREGGMP